MTAHRALGTCRRLRLMALALAAAVSACTDSPAVTGPSAPPTPAALAGTWTLESVQTAGGPVEARPDTATYTLTLAETRAGTTVDCNVCGGDAVLTGTTLRLGPFVCTRAACPTLSFGDRYLRVLEGDHSVRLTGATLELTSMRGTLRLRR